MGATAAPTYFFSSRRRHARFDCDWSSDVCSSDLLQAQPPGQQQHHGHERDDLFLHVVEHAAQGERERSEEHTSELQSQSNLVCRLLLEKKKKKLNMHQTHLVWSNYDHASRTCETD